jgi:ribosome-associated toxin RatA of RatAB toxin-antitoxin module
MITVDRSALVEHPATQMYALVENIEAYPQFLPWCSGVEIVSREPGKTVATLHVLYHGLRQNFTTENINTPGQSIEIRLVKGPFKHLVGLWRFKPLGEEACKVSLHMEYQLASGMLATVVGPVFSHIANTFVDAFVRRADALREKP